MWWADFDKKEVKRMLTLLATLIVWAIIRALCQKNPGPLLVLFALYLMLSVFAEVLY